ncbi:MAG TPA: glycosyltransferase, partial [Candidatus Kapabacteria bacterium]|nr:glycosyltransferase [Candidatus Kapabacteria bacterium]HPO63553.1 glycosyltransferase [Candidatus Kapabacteria bacterium]
MKIAYLSSFYPLRGGIAQFNAALYRAFEKEHQIKAFTFSRQYPNLLFPGKTQYVEKGDNADIIPSTAVLDTINPLSYYSTAKKILDFKPELLISKFWMPFFAPSLGMVAKSLKKKGVKNICIVDNILPHEPKPFDRALINFYVRQQDGFIVMTEQVKNDLLSVKHNAKYSLFPHPLYDHFPKKIEKVTARKELGISNEKKVLLFFGFIRSYKGLDLLVDTLKKLDGSYHLIIAGEDYGTYSSISKQIKELNIENKVTQIVKYISDAEVPAIFSAADVLVLPYKSGTQSGIVGISYHYDLPVIATDVGGLKEMLAPYSTGLIVEKPDSDLIKEKIKMYFENNLYTEFSKNITNYKKKYNWQNLSKAIIELYKS